MNKEILTQFSFLVLLNDKYLVSYNTDNPFLIELENINIDTFYDYADLDEQTYNLYKDLVWNDLNFQDFAVDANDLIFKQCYNFPNIFSNEDILNLNIKKISLNNINYKPINYINQYICFVKTIDNKLYLVEYAFNKVNNFKEIIIDDELINSIDNISFDNSKLYVEKLKELTEAFNKSFDIDLNKLPYLIIKKHLKIFKIIEKTVIDLYEKNNDLNIDKIICLPMHNFINHVKNKSVIQLNTILKESFNNEIILDSYFKYTCFTIESFVGQYLKIIKDNNINEKISKKLNETVIDFNSDARSIPIININIPSYKSILELVNRETTFAFSSWFNLVEIVDIFNHVINRLIFFEPFKQHKIFEEIYKNYVYFKTLDTADCDIRNSNNYNSYAMDSELALILNNNLLKTKIINPVIQILYRKIIKNIKNFKDLNKNIREYNNKILNTEKSNICQLVIDFIIKPRLKNNKQFKYLKISKQNLTNLLLEI